MTWRAFLVAALVFLGVAAVSAQGGGAQESAGSDGAGEEGDGFDGWTAFGDDYPAISERVASLVDGDDIGHRIGGVRWDERSGQISFAVVDPTGEDERLIQNSLALEGLGNVPLSIEVRPAAIAAVDLDQLQFDVLKAVGPMIQGTSWSVRILDPDSLSPRLQVIVDEADSSRIDVESLRLVVERSDAFARLESGAVERATQPDFIVVDGREDNLEKVADKRTTLPPRGADWIRGAPTGSAARYPCSVGFTVYDSATSQYLGLTAGHCVPNTLDGEILMTSPSCGLGGNFCVTDGSAAGDVVFNSFMGPPFPSMTYPEADVLAFELPSSYVAKQLAQVKSSFNRKVNTSVSIGVGVTACHGGIWTKWENGKNQNCKQVIHDDTDSCTTSPGLCVLDLPCTSAQGGPGDSGGLVWKNNGSDKAWAVGMMDSASSVPGESCFSTVAEIMSEVPSSYSIFFTS